MEAHSSCGGDKDVGTKGNWPHCSHSKKAEKPKMLMLRKIQWSLSNWIYDRLGDLPEVSGMTFLEC